MIRAEWATVLPFENNLERLCVPMKAKVFEWPCDSPHGKLSMMGFTIER